jgi:hypothetical protein
MNAKCRVVWILRKLHVAQVFPSTIPLGLGVIGILKTQQPEAHPVTK